MPLTDSSTMPFGRYVNVPMANVPASYLLWLKDNHLNKARFKLTRNERLVLEYIEDNLQALQKEIK